MRRLGISLVVLFCSLITSASVMKSDISLSALDVGVVGGVSVPLQGKSSVDGMFRHEKIGYSYEVADRGTQGYSQRSGVWLGSGKTVKSIGGGGIGSSYNYSGTSSRSGGSSTYTVSSIANYKGVTKYVESRESVSSLSVRRAYGDEDEEDEEHSLGEKDFHDGKWWYWNGTGWIEIHEVDTVPVGDAELWLLVLLIGWVMLKFGIKSALKVVS